MPSISVFYEEVPKVLRGKVRKTQALLRELFRREKVPLESLTYVFCSDERLLDINRSFLQHDYYTDIITFDLAGEGGVLGEIYISVDRVRDNAASLGVSFDQELFRVIFHGALHLCGYKDKSKSEITQMREKEDYYLSLLEEQI